MIHATPPPLNFSPVNHWRAVSVARGLFPGSVRIERIRVSKSVPHFAVITYRHGRIEGSVGNGQVLLELFGFGWQIVDISQGPRFDRATMRSHGIAPRIVTALDPHAPLIIPSADSCRARDPLCNRDSGPANDVEQIRALRKSQRDVVGPVYVRSGYAILDWWGAGGGEDLYRKVDGRWKRIVRSGGSFCSARELHHYGISAPIARELLTGRFACGNEQKEHP